MKSELELTVETRIKQFHFPTPTTQYAFQGLSGRRGWKFDFAWPDVRLALEIEGGSFIKGRHTRGKGFRSDCEKYNEAVLCGWRIIRADTTMVRDDSWIAYLELALEGLKSQRGPV